MHYLIGDLQGCCDALDRLLAEIGFSPSRDSLHVLGDLVNRGPASLATLQRRVTGNTRGSHFYELNAAYDVAEGWNLSGQIGRQVIAHATGLDINYYKVGITKALPEGVSVSDGIRQALKGLSKA